MQVFIMHVGHPGHVDIKYTVTRSRSIEEVLAKLPPMAPERSYFESDPDLHRAFPSGRFNCWGVPSRAAPSFNRTRVGDVVLFAPWIGVHKGGIHQLGVIKAKCPVHCLAASRVLWPDTPEARLFPLIFFFDSEVGFRGWFEFLEDVGYKSNWNPHGWYRRIDPSRFEPHGGAVGYVRTLRKHHGFATLGTAA